MKNKIIYMFLLWGGLFASCESYLEEMPQNKLKPTTTEDYDQVLNYGYLTEQVMPYLDVLSDDVELIPENHLQQGEDIADAYISAYMWNKDIETTLPSGDKAFEKFYQSIFYANVVLENVDAASGMVLDEAEVERTRKNIKGEAYALRAYSYFYLVNLYARPYDPATCATDPGVPVNLSTAAEDKAYPRSSVKVVYEQIVGDLKEAVRLLEANPIAKAAKLKFDAVSARALLARVYLYMQQWDEAIACARQVIQENPAIFNLQEAGKTLNMGNNTVSMWWSTTIAGQDYLSKDNDNVLFVNGLNELLPVLNPNPYTTTFSVNRKLAAVFEGEPDDVRRYYFMVTSTEKGAAKLIYAKNRYIQNTTSPTAATGYTRVIRTEEMYLILAEAYAHKTDGMGSAIGYLNRLRVEKFREGQYVDLKASDFTPESLLEFIAAERRRELCLEGHRWFDLRRTTRPAMERIGYENQVARMAKDDPRYVLQIPGKELSVNPGIGVNPR